MNKKNRTLYLCVAGLMGNSLYMNAVITTTYGFVPLPSAEEEISDAVADQPGSELSKALKDVRVFYKYPPLNYNEIKNALRLLEIPHSLNKYFFEDLCLTEENIKSLEAIINTAYLNGRDALMDNKKDTIENYKIKIDSLDKAAALLLEKNSRSLNKLPIPSQRKQGLIT